MLRSLTITSVRRGWPPAVYTRMVSQLRDSTTLGTSAEILEILKSILDEIPPNPLLLEYVATLSADPHSIIFFPELLHWLAQGEDWHKRPQPVKDLVAYLGRSAPSEWRLPSDVSDVEVLAADCKKIVDQAKQGCRESKMLVFGLSESIIPQLVTQLPEWRSEIEQELHNLGFSLKSDIPLDSGNNNNNSTGSTSNSANSNSTDELDGEQPKIKNTQSSRTMRLLWLEWVLRTAQCFEFSTLRSQLDLLWPSDREAVISYELCITAFDVLAAPGPNNPPHLAEVFIVKALPLLLQKLNDGVLIDSVVARVLTTLDKSVVETAEQRCPGIRAAFGAACADIGLCDPTVMHALHRSHTVNAPLTDLPKLDAIIGAPEQYLEMNPINQKQIAVMLLESARGTNEDGGAGGGATMSRRELSKFSSQLCRNPNFADNLFVHVPVRHFLEALCANADDASSIPDEDGGAGLVYFDLGILLSVTKWLSDRYHNIELPEESWTSSYLGKADFANATQLSPEQQSLMGQWVVGLFSGSGSGIADELLKPFNELSEVLPVLLQQSVRAYRSAVLDRETLKSGLDYFVHPFSATLFAPLVVLVFRIDLLEGRHTSATLECLIFFLTMLLSKKTPDLEIAKATVLRVARCILNDLETLKPPTTEGNTAGTAGTATSTATFGLLKLIDAFTALVKELDNQTSIKFSLENPTDYSLSDTNSLCELVSSSTTALVSWQLNMQGAPIVNSCFQKAKAALGAPATFSLVETAAAVQSKDTELAITVIDGLWSRTNRLADADKNSVLGQTARDLLKQYYTILDSQPKPKPVVVNKASTAVPPPAATAAVGTSSADPGAITANGASADLTVDPQAAGASTAGPDIDMLAEPTAGTNELADSGLEGGNNDNNNVATFDGFDDGMDSFAPTMPQQSGDMDTDFVSQPMMNLADLDSAMDFAWD